MSWRLPRVAPRQGPFERLPMLAFRDWAPAPGGAQTVEAKKKGPKAKEGFQRVQSVCLRGRRLKRDEDESEIYTERMSRRTRPTDAG